MQKSMQSFHTNCGLRVSVELTPKAVGKVKELIKLEA